MRDVPIGDFLDSLADRVPAPGGGAVAALHAAQSAALLGMVARYSTGPTFAEHADVIERVLVRADALRADALELAEDDAEAFRAVTETYGLPKGTDEEKTDRSAAIATALAAAAEPPAAVIVAAMHLVAMAEELLPVGNSNVVTDVAAAADAARAAATTARLNVEVNLTGVTDDAVRERLEATLEEVDDLAARADRVTAAVRERIGS
ncbi:cyclodeaminase/cyclohydrolase family protein [Jiangella gansuensis]|uniref:cyclodeaminase/cyclohydrolase family protein n=1 Tax=Jiangella gansuensis TaxID=281473 RepID=UPI00047C5FD0|nr:cyclodeaminase/cyclohydrolase family protein [Jiangella gansuensis]